MGDITVQHLPRLMTAKQASALVGSQVPAAEPNVTGETVVVDETTRQPVVAYVRLGDVAPLRRLILSIEEFNTTQRASGMFNDSRTFGSSPRRPLYGREGCTPTQLTTGHPELHAELARWAGNLSTRLAEIAPEQAAAGVEATAAVGHDWRIGDSHWTSGVINRTSVLPFHRDSANFKAWSAMPVLRRHTSGGHLTIPEYGLTVACRDGWAVMFPGWELVHGVTPIQITKPGGYRYSIVYYSLRGMKDCFTVAAETAYARRRRSERELAIAERLAAGTPPDIRDYRQLGSIVRGRAAAKTASTGES